MKKIFILLLIPFVSCKKFLTIDPPFNQLTTEKVFQSDETAISAVNGIYSEMMGTTEFFTASGTTFYAGLSSDELRYYSPSNRDAFYTSVLTENVHSTIDNNFWSAAYKFIYSANLVIEKMESSSGMSAAVKDRLRGECQFIRAFCYFYLVNIFGDVPLVLTTDYIVNSKLVRTDVNLVYTQVIKDLEQAAVLLPASFTGSERIRPTKFAAQALLARVHLYRKNWSLAEQMSTAILSAPNFLLINDPAQVFLKNSTESIWQLLPVAANVNSFEGNVILPASANAVPTYVFNTEVATLVGTADKRKTWFTTRSYLGETIVYPTKYKVKQNTIVSEYYTVLRLAEQYLIRCEAFAMQDKIDESLADLNVIRARAGLTALPPLSKEDLLIAIEQERRIELAAEWGHRWFDLKRTGKAAAVLSAVKPAWQPNASLWPVPIQQIRIQPFLQQNPGY